MREKNSIDTVNGKIAKDREKDPSSCFDGSKNSNGIDETKRERELSVKEQYQDGS